MRAIVSGQHAADSQEFAELALGIDTELFAGPAGPESDLERAARLAAAHHILEDLRREDPDLADYAAKLLDDAQMRAVSLLFGGMPRMGKSFHLRVDAPAEPGMPSRWAA